ncbi:MAG TPA: fibronectin type III domain-containing protein, partial [Clostridia bacterium]|nr:fibronectin type III domain-containing protein [Clostridia bacterium]
MRRVKRIISYVLILLFIIPNLYSHSFAAINPAMTTPQMLRVEAINPGEKAIGYIEGNGYYFDLKWNDLTMPAGEGANPAYVNIYMKEIAKYNGASSFVQHDRDLPKSVTSVRMSNLKSGTIYNVMARAYYTKTDGETTFTSGESAPSNTVKVMTDIQLAAYSYGPNQIKIEWDDVWDTGKRIDYKLYISQSKDFANSEPMYIKAAQIGSNSPVVPNTSTGKLEYVQNVDDAGSVYYVKVVPDIADTEIKRNNETKTMAVSSYILASTSKMATTDSGTIWRLSWTPVVTDLNSSDIDLSYKIYKGTVGSTDLPSYVATVAGNTNYFVTLPPNDNSSYYIIRASVKWKNSGLDVYPVDILSDDIYIKEPEVASTPPTPEIVNSFQSTSGDLNSTIISYDDIYDTATKELIKKGELTSTGATILWRVPKKAEGSIDIDTAYDIWLITDPNMIDNPTSNMKIASSIKMGTDNEIKNGMETVGYKYKIPNLTPNSTYYFKIVAKKVFMQYKDGVLTNVAYYSQPALKVIITPSNGPIDQPVVPARPPFKVKTLSGKNVITNTTATIQLKNMWYEKFNTNTGKWEYIRTEKLNAADTTMPYNPIANPPDNINYRKVEYDSGIAIDVGCAEFTDGMDISTLPTQKVSGVPSAVPSSDYVEGRIYNPDQSESASLNTDGKRHNIDIQLTDLQPNTTYIVWVRAERSGTSSGASDPIIITTNPETPETVEKPTVPSFNYVQEGDNFADFGWLFKPGYKYYIKYGTTDNISSASGTASITASDYTKNYYRISGLTPNTQYYFWIQAEATLGSQSSKSEWSDSYPLKTKPYISPDTPLGFGVKNSEDAITKNSITFEWIKQDGMQYILEVSN